MTSYHIAADANEISILKKANVVLSGSELSRKLEFNIESRKE